MNWAEIIKETNITQADVARIFGWSPTTINKKVNNPNSEPRYSEIVTLEKSIGRPIYKNPHIQPLKEYDQLKIPYLEIEGIDNNKLRSPIIKERLQCDSELSDGHWKRIPKNFRIVPMLGDKMDEGRYPLSNGDILIVDISKRSITQSGIFVYTMGLGSEKDVFINNIDKTPDGRVRMSFYNTNYPEFIYHMDELKALDFKVHARVFKNMSLHI